MPEPVMLRYAILRHEGTDDPHFDLLFETAPQSLLAAWRVDDWPITKPARAVRMADHRRIYLEYEGSIGGGRGTVHRVDSGRCEIKVSGAEHFHIHLVAGSSLELFVSGLDWVIRPAA